MTIPVEKVRIGSRWQKSRSGKRYEVVGLAIDSTTSNAMVVYTRLPDDAAAAPSENWYVRPLSEFLGDVLMEQTPTSKTYAPRFVPIA